MTREALEWFALIVSVPLVAGYELRLARAARRNPATTARSAHSVLRSEWVKALSRQPGSELLAVQALRNSLMSATINASTAALALMGSTGLLAKSVGATVLSPRFALELTLALTLFAAYVCSASAMRYYHHASFALSLPVGSPERRARSELAVNYVQRAGILYSWSLRCFLFLAPIVVGLLEPLMTPLAAAGLLFVLSLFDRAPKYAGDTVASD
ncbi:MAG: hypothetical protein RL701_4800 [Pseudomonadota bacterium]